MAKIRCALCPIGNYSTDNFTHWDRVTHIHICVDNLNTIGSDNGTSSGRRQAIIWTNAGILLNGPLGKNLNEISIENSDMTVWFRDSSNQSTSWVIQ